MALWATVPLLWLLRTASWRVACWAGLLCGMCEAFVLAGVAHADGALALALSLAFGLHRGLFAGLAWGMGQTAWTAAAVAGLGALLERGMSLLPYGLPPLLGDTQHVGLFLPLARLGGTYLISLQLLWLSGLLVDLLEQARQAGWILRWSHWQHVSGRLFVALAVALGLQAAAWWTRPALLPGPQVAVVQGGLPTWVYRRAESEVAWRGIPASIYVHLTRWAPAAALTVWPETAVWRWWDADPAWATGLRALQRTRGTLLVGLPRQEGSYGRYNSAVLLRPDGLLVADKRRLALRVEGAFTAGERPGLLAWSEGYLGVVFCLESVVPDYARELVRLGATTLVVLADGSRFGDTPVGRMHAQRSVLRAVETGRSVVHAGQHGFSMLIDPLGAHTPWLAPFTAGSQGGESPNARAYTPFVALGEASLLPAVGLAAGGLVARWRRSWRRRQTAQRP